MDFEIDDTEELIRSAVGSLVADYDDDYWREVKARRRFPDRFWRDLADGGWVGATIPEAYGGQGMGIERLVPIVEAVGANGGWVATNAFTLLQFGIDALVRHGTDAQRERWLPRFADGEAHFAIGVTEPDAGLNTTNIATTAERDGDEYVLDGQKTWTSGIDDADRIVLLARTTPRDAVDRKTDGLSIFLVDPEAAGVEYEEVEMELYHPQRTYDVYLDGARVPAANLVGEEGEGLSHLFDSLNDERILVATVAETIGRAALDKACEYANQRVVFDDPIGAYQSIQHPLADAHSKLETARLAIRKAAWLYEREADQKAVGAACNVAKLRASEAGWDACEQAMTTFGGLGGAKDVDVAEMWGFVRHLRTGPLTQQMVRNFIAENELGLPRSY